MDAIFTDPQLRQDLVNDAAARLGVAPWVIEKDLWVCWVLARLQEIPDIPGMTFKGGTSLSKVHKLIKRFSEDIDLTLSREGWGFEGERDPLSDGLSGKQRTRLVKEITTRATAVVRDDIVPGLEALCREGLRQGTWSLKIDESDPQTVHFAFPSPTATYAYGKSIVKMEFGARGEPWPTTIHTVVPYLLLSDSVHAPTA